MPRLPARFTAATAAVLLAALSTPAADWPHWRGPSRTDVTAETSGFADGKWLAEKPAWRVKLGEGASSPVVADGRVYHLGYEGTKDVLRCLSAADGKELWAVEYKSPKYGRFHVGDEGFYSGPSSTPEYDGATGLLYTLGTDGDLNCWDTRAKGKRLWGRNLSDDYKVGRRPKLTAAPQRDYGYTTSPLVVGDALLVEVGSTTRGTLVAFDRRTGKELWASDLKDEAGHTGGPAPMTVEGVPCVAVMTQRNLAILRLDAGKEGKTVALFPWVTDFANTIAGPAVHGDSVLVTSAYNKNAIVRVRISLKGAKEVWRAEYPSKVCTPVVHEGSVYLAWQKVRCLDWETGALRWQGGAVGDPGSCVLTADGRVVVYGQRGKLTLVEGAGRSKEAYKVLAARDTGFASPAWPHVALAGGCVYCRDREGNLACFARAK